VHKKVTITKDSALKVQWLNFLAKCNKQTEEPNDAEEIIKEGYNIMKMANWNEDQKFHYFAAKRTEALEKMEKEEAQKKQEKMKRKLDKYEERNEQDKLKIQKKDEELKEKNTNSIKSAQKFLELNLPKETVSSLTGLNLEQLEVISNHKGEIESLYELLNPQKEENEEIWFSEEQNNLDDSSQEVELFGNNEDN